MSKVHWRKNAKICPSCNKLKSAKRFVCNLQFCSECEFDNAIFKLLKLCKYCRNFRPKEEVKSNVCNGCLKICLEKHHKFKAKARMKKRQKYVCVKCLSSKGCLSFERGTDLNNPVCKVCKGNEQLEKEGRFRCFHCGSSFRIEQRGWAKTKGNWNCLRCSDKDRKRNVLWAREWRKRPDVKEYYRLYSRYRWHFVEKPERNKLLMLQWSYGLSKKRQINLKGYWHVLNRELFKKDRKYFGLGTGTQRVLDEVDAIMRKFSERIRAQERTAHIPSNPKREFDF